MSYLDHDRLAALDGDWFRSREPFPWVCAEKLVTDDGYRELRESLPDPSRFKAVFGKPRKYGQASHDRYTLEYKRWLKLPNPWQAFVDELQSPGYRAFVARMLGHDDFVLHFHWHYTPQGCSVSPHCDATWKLGSQIFYLNTDDDWQPDWGGETLVLEDHGRFRYDSAPAFEDFDAAYGCPALGNRSLLFMRRDHSWHGVRPIQCPQGRLRKVFIVEFRQSTALQRLRTAIGV